MADFLQDNPNTRVRIISTFEDGDYDMPWFDVGVFNAPPFDNRFDYSPLFETDIYPVCAPEALGPSSTGIPLEKLENFLLLSVPNTWNEPDDWDHWLDAADLSRETMKFGSIFDNYPLVREAVLNNHGISVARAPFCARDLERGRLIKPFDISVPEPGQWYLATPKERSKNPKHETFVDWLFDQIEADPTMRFFRG